MAKCDGHPCPTCGRVWRQMPHAAYAYGSCGDRPSDCPNCYGDSNATYVRGWTYVDDFKEWAKEVREQHGRE